MYWDMIGRNIGLFSREEQEKLRDATVLMAGVGGAGGITAEILTRMGIGKMIIADPGDYAITDLNRQVPSTQEALGRNKAQVTAEHVKRINPELELEVVEDGIVVGNVSRLIKKADIVVDSIELYALVERVLLHREARKRGLFLVTSPQTAFGSLLLVFEPEGITLEQFLGIPDDAADIANFRLPLDRFAIGIQDRFPKEVIERIMSGEGYIPFVCSTSALSGALGASETAFILTGKREPVVVPEYISVDLFAQELKRASFKL